MREKYGDGADSRAPVRAHVSARAAIDPYDVPQLPAHAAGDIDDGTVTRGGDIGHAGHRLGETSSCTGTG